MENKDDIENLSSCQSSCRPVEVPTEDELNALNAMRAIKERVRYLKKRLSEIAHSDRGHDVEERPMLEEEMAQLKTEWDRWEQKREKAARERMILLGHEEGSL